MKHPAVIRGLKGGKDSPNRTFGEKHLGMGHNVPADRAEKLLAYVDFLMNEHMLDRNGSKDSTLSRQDIRVLEFIYFNVQPTMGEMADYMRVAPSRITALIDNLVVRGYVRREKALVDRRSSIVLLTDDGRTLIETFRSRKRELCVGLLLPLTDSEQLKFLELVGKSLPAVN